MTMTFVVRKVVSVTGVVMVRVTITVAGGRGGHDHFKHSGKRIRED